MPLLSLQINKTRAGILEHLFLRLKRLEKIFNLSIQMETAVVLTKKSKLSSLLYADQVRISKPFFFFNPVKKWRSLHIPRREC